jgi:magnesium chelatase family protein
MITKINSYTLHGIQSFPVAIEISISKGIGCFFSGMVDESVTKGLDRIKIALLNNGFEMPRTRLVINMTPAGARMHGTAFDLPIIIGIMKASQQLTDISKFDNYLIAGELGLDGSIHPVRGALGMAVCAAKNGYKGIILPYENAVQASLIKGIDIYAVRHIKEVVQLAASDIAVHPYKRDHKDIPLSCNTNLPDFSEVKGQQYAKRALEVAAAGGHHILMIGPPGGSKSMLAKRLPSILPPMTDREILETTHIYNLAGRERNNIDPVTQRPFRNPHHNATEASLTGGGSYATPGEITLAHNGVLFLDEFAELKPGVMEALREPLEDRWITVARSKLTARYPASFMLVAAMNPCLCGYNNHPSKKCSCSKRALWWFRRKISGPVLDRIDIQLDIQPIAIEEMIDVHNEPEPSVVIQKRVINARTIQQQRFKEQKGIHCNAQMLDKDIEVFCPLEPEASRFLLKKIKELDYSARAYTRILKIARTISDLAGTHNIKLNHVAEALHYRTLDKQPAEKITTNLKNISSTGYSQAV